MMTAFHDQILMWLFGGVLCLLVILTFIGRALKRRHNPNISRSTINNFNAQIGA
jgi:hypothetical protein